ncbi:bifunctional diaminohydroxyphosphoribosylaminopyrimidine deaminase/5-amino-6-(5-phosphoribosylamino)uracil reductase RibD [Pseudomonadales bacterium]|nr:bifunctional diaminohydroxyphosphoribosylaminopyrimidine deaminase/5-amino-6-(5-phosphoribosylamino)uracil reductase RibD [Pseudomonadales bacterium]
MNHETFMAEALREAERGLYTAQPNPRVGCVLVKAGQVIARGFHLQTGHGHAEANALKVAGTAARDATAYVTLEPCSFVGRTPACADSLIKAGIKTVVYAMTDPHPGNCGKGLEKLVAAGIEVVGPVLQASAQALNPGHIKRFATGMPYVRLKLAMSLDGKTALANGRSQWITGAAARHDVQRLRARSSAIVTGVETVIADDPALTVRATDLEVEFAELAAGVARPLIVMDSNLRIPLTAKVLTQPQTQIACGQDRVAEAPAHLPVLGLARDVDGRLDIRDLLENLGAQDCNEVLFECGATLAGSLVQSGLLDEIVMYIASRMMGHDARSLLNLPTIATMEDLVELEIADVRRVGEDLRLTMKVAARKS